jgi:fermentation-respiration switch protein FrsA (DUF1100 family)
MALKQNGPRRIKPERWTEASPKKKMESDMTHEKLPPYALLDRPDILNALFHPRAEYPDHTPVASAVEIAVPVAPDIAIGGRFHIHHQKYANILFFHGNGEIVADYDDLGAVYAQYELNFLPVDYRGYGRSDGSPTVTHMMADCHRIFHFTREWLQQAGCTGPLLVMGRSLGSASALELAAHHGDQIAGLIIESGFAKVRPLLQLLGVDVHSLKGVDRLGFENTAKIACYDKPTLVIHAQWDHIIPFSDGEALYAASPADQKTLLMIPDANHNDIFYKGLSQYMAALKKLAHRTG